MAAAATAVVVVIEATTPPTPVVVVVVVVTAAAAAAAAVAAAAVVVADQEVRRRPEGRGCARPAHRHPPPAQDPACRVLLRWLVVLLLPAVVKVVSVVAVWLWWC